MKAGATEESFGCGGCWPASAAEAWEARKSLTRGARLIDDSHLAATILACPACGQKFVSVFLEHVDWVDGDDPQYWTVLPITDAEAADLAIQEEGSVVTALTALAPSRRCLQRDYPKGGPVRTSWGSGILIVY